MSLKSLLCLLMAWACGAGPAAAQAVASEADLPRLVQQWTDHEVLVQQTERTDALLHFSARVAGVDARIHLAPCARVEVYLPPGSRLWGSTRVGARCQEGAVRWNVSLPATVRVLGPAWVLRRDVALGAALSDADVEISEVDWAADSSPVLSGPSAWQGDALRRAALQLSGLMQKQGDTLRATPGLASRLRRAALDISLQHAALLRWLSLAERSVGILVPSAAPKATYAAPAGRASLYRGFSS